MTIWELEKQSLCLADTVWDVPFLFPLSQSFPQILSSEIYVTAFQTIDLPWDQPNDYRGQHGFSLLTRKIHFGWAAPHSLIRVHYGCCLSIAHPFPVAAEFRSSFFGAELWKRPLVPEISWRLGLSLNDRGNWERCLRTGWKLRVACFWAFL